MEIVNLNQSTLSTQLVFCNRDDHLIFVLFVVWFSLFHPCPPSKVVFERFADTRGTYHNHTQIVPLPATLAPAARRAFERW
jgi:hypothetical protein